MHSGKATSICRMKEWADPLIQLPMNISIWSVHNHLKTEAIIFPPKPTASPFFPVSKNGIPIIPVTPIRKLQLTPHSLLWPPGQSASLRVSLMLHLWHLSCLYSFLPKLLPLHGLGPRSLLLPLMHLVSRWSPWMWRSVSWPAPSSSQPPDWSF